MNSRMLPFILLLIALVNGNPFERRKRSFDDDSVIIVDTPSKNSRSGGFPFGFPFARDDDETMPSFFDDGDDDEEFFKRPIEFRPFGSDFGFEDSQMKNFWQRINEFLKDMQSKVTGEGTEFGNLPPNYHNTTYETKNVNGSIITVNQTIDKHSDNNTQSFFHIKVVQFKPEKPVEGTTELNKTPEKPESPVLPEIKPEAVPEGNTEKTSVDETHNKPAEEATKDDTPLVEENEP